MIDPTGHTKESYEKAERASMIVERFEDGTFQVEPEALVGAIMSAIGDTDSLSAEAWDRIASLNKFILGI